MRPAPLVEHLAHCRSRPGWRTSLVAVAAMWMGTACGGDKGSTPPQSDAITAAAPAATQLKVVTVHSGLSHPWGLAFLPDGSMLVTERAGALRRVSADGQTISPPIAGVPAVFHSGQGGLLDVQIDPDFATSPWVYLSYAEAGTGSETGLAGTAVARGLLNGQALSQVQVIFRQSPKVSGSGHFGARLVFARDKTLFITLGERQQDSPSQPGTQNAQNPANSLGKVVRITRDGSIPADNPRFAASGALPGLWSIGHRNPQGAALHPDTGELWLTEHGPQGGDELNIALPGGNFGWPLVSYGCPYGSIPLASCRVNGGTHRAPYTEPLSFWAPFSIAPSGLAFNHGSRYPGWEGNLFAGALNDQSLWRLVLQGRIVVSREALLKNEVGRIRDVRQGPDGWLYLLTDEDDGRILRLET
jgi:glucose/arabinose dehydrogenase